MIDVEVTKEKDIGIKTLFCALCWPVYVGLAVDVYASLSEGLEEL